MYVSQTDALLADVKGMAKYLEELSFYHAGVTAEGIRHLADSPPQASYTLIAWMTSASRRSSNCRKHYQTAN